MQMKRKKLNRFFLLIAVRLLSMGITSMALTFLSEFLQRIGFFSNDARTTIYYITVSLLALLMLIYHLAWAFRYYDKQKLLHPSRNSVFKGGYR